MQGRGVDHGKVELFLGRAEAVEEVEGSTSDLFTWRNAIGGGILAFALGGVVATGWIVFGDRAPPEQGDRSSSRSSVAVLPFDNLSPDPDHAYFADGMHEEILTQLAGVGDLKIISRTSVLRYRDREESIRTIAEDLDVATILEGSVQRDGDRIRVTAQLIDARTDEHIWADRFDRDVVDAFAIQTAVAEEIVDALQAELSPDERRRLQERRTEVPEGYDAYL
jgi:TolB-like protein